MERLRGLIGLHGLSGIHGISNGAEDTEVMINTTEALEETQINHLPFLRIFWSLDVLTVTREGYQDQNTQKVESLRA